MRIKKMIKNTMDWILKTLPKQSYNLRINNKINPTLLPQRLKISKLMKLKIVNLTVYLILMILIVSYYNLIYWIFL
jgi:hypothetical protein